MKFRNITKAVGKAVGVLGLAGVIATGIYATKANAEEVKDSAQAVEIAKQPSYDVFAGSLLFGPQDEINNVLKVDYKNGARVVVETNHTPWTDKVNETSVALRSLQLGRFQGEFSYDDSNAENHSYTGIARATPIDNFVIRVGVVENQEGSGVFVGGKTSLEGITINGNAFRHDNKTGFNGYLDYSEPLSKDYQTFASLGGSTRKKQIASVAGIISDGKAGVYIQTVVDLAKDEQSGRIIFAPKGWARKADTYKFKTAVLTNAEMNGEFSDNTIISWPRYDAKSVDGVKGHGAIVSKWSNSKNTTNIEAGYWNRPDQGTLIGITPKVSYDKVTRKLTPSLKLDILAPIPGTPFEAAANINQNLRTGDSDGFIYLGFVKGF